MWKHAEIWISAAWLLELHFRIETALNLNKMRLNYLLSKDVTTNKLVNFCGNRSSCSTLHTLSLRFWTFCSVLLCLNRTTEQYYFSICCWISIRACKMRTIYNGQVKQGMERQRLAKQKKGSMWLVVGSRILTYHKESKSYW